MFRRPTLSEAVMEEITRLIQIGRFRPGEALPSERELAAEFGISRTSVREALKALASMGLLEIKAGQGTFVARDNARLFEQPLSSLLILTKSNVQELFEARKLIEVALAGLAAERATESHVSKLQLSVEAMQRNYDLGDANAFSQADFYFHQAIARAAKNGILSTIFDTIRQLLNEVQRKVASIPGTFAPAIEYHQRITSAIGQRNVEMARGLMYKHLCDVEKTLMAVCTNLQSDTDKNE